jgi:ABC-type nitrate/sulfonate/bicarbonate transport system permease component
MITLGVVGTATSAAVRLVGHRWMAWRAKELAMEGR